MPISVLIVEDEFIIAEDLSVALSARGYTIFGIAYSFDQAIALLEKGRPDIVLVDITLDYVQSGITLGKLLNEQWKIPYLYITAHEDPLTMKEVLPTHPGGFIVKPFRRESVCSVIEEFFKIDRNRDKHEEKDPGSSFGIKSSFFSDTLTQIFHRGFILVAQRCGISCMSKQI